MNSSYTNKRVYEVAGVTRQAIHQFCSRRADYEQRVEEAEAMLILHRKGHGGLGLVKAYGQIKPGGLGRDRFVYEMTRRGYALPRPRNYSRTTRSDGYRYPNLIKGLMINDVNLIWQSDTTYFRLGERWVYLTFIIDIYSRLIVGYAFSHSLRAEANVRALKMALANRKGADLSKLIFHSDGGTQYRFKPFVEQLRQRGISSSMCTAATDNAYAEKLNDVIKNEYLAYRSNQLGKRLSSILPQVVDNYCTRRHHGQLPLRCSPSEYEQWLLTEAGLERRPRLLVRDGQSRRQEWEPDVGAKAFEHPLATAVAGVSQILPAHVKLDHPIQDRQLSLAFN